jgi:FtsP/CotA-like multicopper oxidase with cupredoxin domain
MDRRNFLNTSLGSVTAIFVGSVLSRNLFPEALAVTSVQSLEFSITDAIKEMIIHNSINKAECNYWIYKEKRFKADCPGPIIVAVEGDEIQVKITNQLDENHAFFIPGVVNSGPIAPGKTKTFSFIAPKGGTYLYHDNLNAPVNRMMGLHGAFVVMPKKAVAGNRFTPYTTPTPAVQELFNDFGSSHFPGLSWEEADPFTKTPKFRQYVWVLHEASPILFAEVANYPKGKDYPADKFVKAFRHDPYANTFETGKLNRIPHYFTINGQSGFFSHHNPFITPWRRVGEPLVIRILNAGLNFHSLHIHANHVYVLSINGQVKNNLLWVDTFSLNPTDTVDWAVPMHRPPDIPNKRGIGLSDEPLTTLNGGKTWPPEEEFGSFFPEQGRPFSVRQSPLSYPMHDHIETTQTARGGNYNTGMMSGINFTGDRNTPGLMNFPNYPAAFDVADLNESRSCAPEIPDKES